LGGDRFSQAKVSALEARAYFLFDGKKKLAKEKATPGSAPLRGSLRYSPGRAACQNSPVAQTRQADTPRPTCVAQRLSRGPKGGAAKAMRQELACCGRLPKQGKNQNQRNTHSARAVFPGPLRGAEQRRNAGGSRLALSEPQASLASRPAFRVAQGTGVAGTDPGVAFSLATFFWPHKRKYARQQGGNPCQSSRPMPIKAARLSNKEPPKC